MNTYCLRTHHLEHLMFGSLSGSETSEVRHWKQLDATLFTTNILKIVHGQNTRQFTDRYCSEVCELKQKNLYVHWPSFHYAGNALAL